MDIPKNILSTYISLTSIVKILIAIFLVITVVMFWLDLLDRWKSKEAVSIGVTSSDAVSDSQPEQSVCNIARVVIRGSIATYTDSLNNDPDIPDNTVTSSDAVVPLIEQAEQDSSMKALLLDIDSTGGSPVAAQEIEKAVQRSNKPVLAMIHASGLSAAYYIATGADAIIATEVSDIGSIGATMSYVDNAKKNENEGLTYNELNTGVYKDTGDPDKPLTAAERLLLERDLRLSRDVFVRTVSDNRKIPLETVQRLADGSSMMGAMALQNKLIDTIGGIEEAKSWFKEKIGAEPKVCWN